MKAKSNIRIVDIAKMAKVSVGTVDRILHNRGHVSEEKQERVKKVLKEMNYEPNMVARFLASKKTYHFAFVIPAFAKGEYWELVSQGIEKAVAELRAFNVSVDYLLFDQYDKSSFKEVISKMDHERYSGIVIATLFDDLAIKLSKKLDEIEIPYVYIDTAIKDQHNISYFGADSFVSGTVTAKLLLSEIGLTNNIIIAHIKYTGKESPTQTQKTEAGFMDYLKRRNYKGKISHLDIFIDDMERSTKELDIILKGVNGTVGGVVFNSKIYAFSDLIDHHERAGITFKLIGYDPIEKNLEAMKSDKVSFLISQRSVQQGYDCVKLLSNNLIFNTPIEKENLMPIDILIKENINFYNNYKI